MNHSARSLPFSEIPGRRERRKAFTRKELLLAGRKLFSDKGLYDCRVEEITALADIGKGTLYQYFRNKEELIIALVDEGFGQLSRLSHERASGAGDFEETVTAIVESHLAFFTENRDLMKIFHQVRGMLKFNHREWRPLRHLLEAHLDSIARDLERAAPAGTLGRARARELANLLFGTLSGWISVRVATDPRTTLVPAPRGLVKSLVAMSGRFAASNGRATALPARRRATGTPRGGGRPVRSDR